MSKIVQLPVASQPNQPKERRKKRADGLYQVELRYTDESGASRKKSFYGNTQAEANKKRSAFKLELDKGTAVNMMDVTVSEWVSMWLSKRTKKDAKKSTTGTHDMYKRESDRLVAAVGQKRLRDVVKSDILSILEDRSGMSKSAISQTRLVLRQVFKAAVGDRVISYSPFDDIGKNDLPKGISGSHRAITPEERQLITSTWKEHRFGLMAMLMLYSGLRRGEAAALDWSNIDLDKLEIHITGAVAYHGNSRVEKGPKSASGIRIIPIWAPLHNVLSSIPNKTGLLCVSVDGKPLTESACTRGWESYQYFLSVKQNGCTYRWANEQLEGGKAAWKPCDIRMHDLRHTFCTMLYDAGVDVKRAQYLMGHSSLDVTMKIYTHLSDERKKRSDDAMAAYLQQSVGKSVGKPIKYKLKRPDLSTV